jgi:hypothetical protein
MSHLICTHVSTELITESEYNYSKQIICAKTAYDVTEQKCPYKWRKDTGDSIVRVTECVSRDILRLPKTRLTSMLSNGVRQCGDNSLKLVWLTILSEFVHCKRT